MHSNFRVGTYVSKLKNYKYNAYEYDIFIEN
jgi:hypothetical protein